MRFLLFLSLPVMLLSCFNSGQLKNASEDNTLDTAALVQRVNMIYEDVFKRYGSHFEEIEIDTFAEVTTDTVELGLLELYCSQEWEDLISDVVTADVPLVNSGEIGFFEADYWIMGQDWQDLSVSDIHVTAMTDSTARVVLNLHNCGSVTPVMLEMKHEEGEWKIDNFIDLGHEFDWKARMKEYLKEKWIKNSQ